MKVECTRTVKLPEIKKIVNDSPEIVQLFKQQARQIEFAYFHCDDGEKQPKDKEDFVFVTGNETERMEATLTLGEVKGIVAQNLNLGDAKARVVYDGKSAGDGDGTYVYTVTGLQYKYPQPTP